MSEPVIYAASWLINPDLPPLAGGAILVRDGVVSGKGTLAELRRLHAAQVIEYPGCAIVPGFVNAHTHLELTHFPSWRLRKNIDYSPRTFADWLIQLIKISRSLTADDYPPSLREGIRMCLDSGTTAIGGIVSNPAHAGIYSESSLSGRLYFEVLGQDAGHFNEKLAGALAAADLCQGEALKNGISPHTPYTIAEEHLSAIHGATVGRRLPLSIHISESSAETDYIFNSSGPLADDFYPFVGWERYLGRPLRCSSTELLDRNGLLTRDTLAVHCVHVNLADARILRERGVSIVLCPRSNDKLDVGRAPVALFKKLEIPLSLGTDSLASNDSLSMWDEMRYAMEAFSGELSAEDLFSMVTRGGASALKLSDCCGELENGRRADFQVVTDSGGNARGLLERIIEKGAPEEVYTGGVRYTG